MDVSTPAAARRVARPGARRRPPAGVADPSRGTRAAAVLGLAAATATAAWAVLGTPTLACGVVLAAALCVAAAASELLVVQVGPRTWYTASTPVVVLAALLGGPAAGVAAGLSTQLLRPNAVWRRRIAEGGIAAGQGLAAGIAGTALLAGGRPPVAAAAAGMALAIAVNSVGRLLVILDRDPAHLIERWPRGIAIDALEGVLLVPLLGVLVAAADEGSALPATALFSLIAILLLAQRSRTKAAAELAAEQANARRDQLTGAPNRRAFEEAMRAEHARVVRGSVPAGLYLVDLDRFKSVNDRFGHAVGDRVLIEVVRRLTDGLRPTDLVARWGGEEIAILAPGVRGRRQLQQFAERIRLLVRDAPVATSTTVLPVTVSVGGTLIDGSVPPATALEHADRALYDAKRTRDACAISLPPRLTLRLESA